MKPGDIFLGRLEIEIEGEQAGLQYHTSLTSKRCEELESAIDNIKKWIKSDADIFALVHQSYQTFKRQVDETKAAFRQTPVPEHDLALLGLNSAFLSYLSMMRLYTDHTETFLSHDKSPEGKAELEAFKVAAAKEFDNTFEYKFACKLRNYSQHCGLPISDLQASSTLDQRTGKETHEFGVNFERDTLLRRFKKWGTITKSSLEAQPEKFDVVKVADAVFKSLENVRESTVQSTLHRVEDDIALLRDVINSMPPSRTLPIIFKVRQGPPAINGGRQISLDMVKFPVIFMDIADTFKNS